MCLGSDLQREKEDAVSDPLLDMSKMDDVAPGEVSVTTLEILWATASASSKNSMENSSLY